MTLEALLGRPFLVLNLLQDFQLESQLGAVEYPFLGGLTTEDNIIFYLHESLR